MHSSIQCVSVCFSSCEHVALIIGRSAQGEQLIETPDSGLADHWLLYRLAIISLMIANFRKLDLCEGETKKKEEEG